MNRINRLPSLKDIYGFIISLVPILEAIREEYKKKKVGKEIIESIDPVFEKVKKQLIEVISEVFSIFGLVLFLDHDEFEEVVDEVVSKLETNIRKVNDAYVELFGTIGLYRDVLKEVLGLEKWSMIEPLVNMAMYEKRIDWRKLEEIKYFDRVMEKIYGSPTDYADYISNNVKKNVELLQKKLEQIMKKYGIDVSKEINTTAKLLTRLPRILSMIQ